MPRNRKHFLIIGLLLTISLGLIACSGSNTDQPKTDAETTPENQVVLPIIDSSNPAEDPYPASEEAAQPEAYPEPETQTDAYPATEAQAQNEPYPAPEETAVKPTPRGNDLVATDPATVSLASGKIQLVEMFAFW